MRMDRQIKLQYMPDGVDAAGQPNGQWTNYRTCWAAIVEEKFVGQETARGDQQEHRGQMRIHIMHPRQGRFPTVEHRATWVEGDTGTARTVNIKHIERKGSDRRQMVLHCVEVG